jgi:MIP family channel proteins
MRIWPHLTIPEDDLWQALWRSGVSEFFATMIFVFIGCGSVVATQATLGLSSIQIPSLTLISLAHGFCIMVLVYTVGEISGGHINPAVTWATLLTQKISLLRAGIYWVSQLLGGMVGAGVLRGIIPQKIHTGLGCHSINAALSVGQGFAAEIVFTFIFIFVVFATAISPFVGKIAPLAGGSEYGPGKLTPFAVGMTILILHAVGIPLTGASMNPARSFGPAVVMGCWDNHWIYWIGPLFGSTAAALIAQVIFLSSPDSLAAVFRGNREQSGSVQSTPKVAQNKDFAPIPPTHEDVVLEDQ